jgi:hypothetical protein
VAGQHHAPKPLYPCKKDPEPDDESINPNQKSTLTLHVHVYTPACGMTIAANLCPDTTEQDIKENEIFGSLL